MVTKLVANLCIIATLSIGALILTSCGGNQSEGDKPENSETLERPAEQPQEDSEEKGEKESKQENESNERTEPEKKDD